MTQVMLGCRTGHRRRALRPPALVALALAMGLAMVMVVARPAAAEAPTAAVQTLRGDLVAALEQTARGDLPPGEAVAASLLPRLDHAALARSLYGPRWQGLDAAARSRAQTQVRDDVLRLALGAASVHGERLLPYLEHAVVADTRLSRGGTHARVRLLLQPPDALPVGASLDLGLVDGRWRVRNGEMLGVTLREVLAAGARLQSGP